MTTKKLDAPETVGEHSPEVVPDNTPTPHVAPSAGSKAKDAADIPAGYAYVIHPKNGERCLVDEKSIPELLVDGYLPAE